MKHCHRGGLPLLLLTICAAPALAEAPPVPKQATLAYPATRSVDVIDDYHGRKIADPVPLARGPRVAGHGGLGGGAEQGHLCVP